jgi:hypothetical protein
MRFSFVSHVKGKIMKPKTSIFHALRYTLFSSYLVKLAFIFLSALAPSVANAQVGNGQWMRFENRWKPRQFINIENGSTQVSHIRDDWWSAIWIPEKSGNYFRFKSRWKGCYLHIENGRLECGSILQGWHSAQWQMSYSNGFARIQNRWRGCHINIENGTPECSEIKPEWWSAEWKTVSVSAAPPWYNDDWNCKLDKQAMVISIGRDSAVSKFKYDQTYGNPVALKLTVKDPAKAIVLTDRHNGGESDFELNLGPGVWPKTTNGRASTLGMPRQLVCAATPEQP